uniref:DUF5641 domain-containing protein n=1 Tax=Meloidogyne javanica TaxID=6303 RepID=A0A915LZT8_MELJA
MENSDPNDPEYLPKRELKDVLREEHEKAIKKMDKFWSIWHTHYLAGLRERQEKAEKNGSSVAPCVGRVVLIEEEMTPRSSWRMGRIEKLYKGEGGVRTARLKVTGTDKLWKRALNQLYPLEIEGEELGMTNCVGSLTWVQIFGPGFLKNENNILSLNQINSSFIQEMDEELELDYDEIMPEVPSEKEESNKNRPELHYENGKLRS